MSPYNIAGLIPEDSEEVSTQIAKNCRRRQPHSYLTSPPRGILREYPHKPYISRVPLIISGTGKATDFTFGQCIQRIHRNKIALKNLEKRERGRIRGLRKSYYGRPIGTHHDSFERYHSRPPTVVSSYRPSIVTFPLSLCVSEILSLLCSTFIYIFIHRKR